MSCTICGFISILSWLIALAIVLKIYLKLYLRRPENYTCLLGKTAIVTGANTGIGYVTALDFAKRGARVILACRNEARAEDAQRKIIKATNNKNVVYRLVDMASLKSVKEFAKQINETEDKIDILVNNAGAAGLGNHITEDGVQITLQVNHVSGFLLTHLLLDKIKASAPSRIVNVASIASRFFQFDVNKFTQYPSNVSQPVGDMKMYSYSKLCNILFTTELAKKLEGTGVTVNTLHPGTIKTEVWRNVPGVFKFIIQFLADTFFKTAEEGARTIIYVATSKDVEGVTGKLFYNCRAIELYPCARGTNLAKAVWQKSEELAGLEN